MPEHTIRYLCVEAVEATHKEVLAAHGGLAGIRDQALLESAVAAPQASFGGEPLLQDPVEIAAAYLFYLCSNHPFNDGNKRTGLASCLVFLEANNLFPDPDLPARNVDAWEALVLAVAASDVDREGTTRGLRVLLENPDISSLPPLRPPGS